MNKGIITKPVQILPVGREIEIGRVEMTTQQLINNRDWLPKEFASMFADLDEYLEATNQYIVRETLHMVTVKQLDRNVVIYTFYGVIANV